MSTNIKFHNPTDHKFTGYFPDGIDAYFENVIVGSEIQEAAVPNLNVFGRVAVCGIISEYTNGGRRATPEMLAIVYKIIKMQGFLAADRFDVTTSELAKFSHSKTLPLL
ncbi:hypothetical protein Patl1_13098 [Pistacia atlantica]|uniref:Uncharacterized protein n=1 Tax=Pistacia atlantica TaxID=434234 RepID=A0ACC1AWM2_9ROSI|nr:hypothetical protein Patl1_13098 [Pistacia atlantica]